MKSKAGTRHARLKLVLVALCLLQVGRPDARTLERGKFDGLFLADVGGVYDVYGASPDTALREAV